MWLGLIRVGGYQAWSRGVAPKSLRRWGLTRCCKQKRGGGLGRRRSRRWSRWEREKEREQAREEEEREQAGEGEGEGGGGEGTGGGGEEGNGEEGRR